MPLLLGLGIPPSEIFRTGLDASAQQSKSLPISRSIGRNNGAQTTDCAVTPPPSHLKFDSTARYPQPTITTPVSRSQTRNNGASSADFTQVSYVGGQSLNYQGFLLGLQVQQGGSFAPTISSGNSSVGQSPSSSPPSPPPTSPATLYTDTARDTTGALFQVNFIPLSGRTGPGNFWGSYRGPGDIAFSTPTVLTDGTSPLVGDSASSFALTYGRDNSSRWWLEFLVYSESSLSYWWAASEGSLLGFTRWVSP